MLQYNIPKRLRGFTFEEEDILQNYFSKAEIKRIKKEINAAPNSYSAATGETIHIEREINSKNTTVATVKFYNKLGYGSWNFEVLLDVPGQDNNF